MANKATHFTRVEGGNIVKVTFDIYEADLDTLPKPEIREVHSHIFKQKIKTRVVKIDKAYVKSLFFEDGKIYDVVNNKFSLRSTKE